MLMAVRQPDDTALNWPFKATHGVDRGLTIVLCHPNDGDRTHAAQPSTGLKCWANWDAALIAGLRVRRAGSTESAQHCALKIIDAAASDSPQVLVEFRREAAMLAGVGHRDLTVIHEVGEADGRPIS
jgi:hypothetical protein